MGSGAKSKKAMKHTTADDARAKKRRKSAKKRGGSTAQDLGAEFEARLARELDRLIADATDQLESVLDDAELEARRRLEALERTLDGQLRTLHGEIGMEARASLAAFTSSLATLQRDATSRSGALEALVAEHTATTIRVAHEAQAAAESAAAEASAASESLNRQCVGLVAAADAQAVVIEGAVDNASTLADQFDERIRALTLELETRARAAFDALDALVQPDVEQASAEELDPAADDGVDWSWTAPNADDLGAIDDPGFFGRMASDLRSAPDPVGAPSASAAVGTAVVAPAVTPAPTPAAPAPVATAVPTWAPRSFSEPVAVHVAAPLAALVTSARALARTAADQRVRIEVVHRAAPGSSLASYLRLTVLDVAGCWEFHDIAATADSLAPRAAVLDLPELIEAFEAQQQREEGADVQIRLEVDVTVGTTLVLARGDDGLKLSYDRKRVEQLDLRGAGRDGLVVQTQLGRLDVPPRLLSLLRSRQATDVELLAIDGLPYLSARVSAPSALTSATMIAPLPGAAGDSSQLAWERRDEHSGHEIAQLVGALSSDTSAAELERILTTGIGYTRRLVASHPALPPALIDELVRDGTDAMRAAAASNPGIGADSAERAASDPSELVRTAIARNSALAPECLDELASDTCDDVRVAAASNPSTPPELLRRLASDPEGAVRAGVAAHPATEHAVLVGLADDDDAVVCAAVARNPECPSDLLPHLAGVVPDAVMANPKAPVALLTAGSRIEDHRLRAAVAGNPATPQKVLDALSRDDDPGVLRALVDNPSALATSRRRATRRLQSTEHDTGHL